MKTKLLFKSLFVISLFWATNVFSQPIQAANYQPTDLLATVNHLPSNVGESEYGILYFESPKTEQVINAWSFDEWMHFKDGHMAQLYFMFMDLLHDKF